MAVRFETADRCLSNCATHGANWPDVPWDQECTGSPCHVGGPTFWTTRRLISVTTELWSGTGTTYNPVTTWSFGQGFLNPNDGTRAGLVLERISQTGHVGETTTTPDVTFQYTQLHNRVDPLLTSDHSPPMNWARIAHIVSESGGRVEVTYAPPDCVAGTAQMPDPNALQDNTRRCYPVRWTPPGYTSTILDFFHKYVVAEVHDVDAVTPGNPTTVTRYEYVGAPAWHYTDDDGLVKAENKTWSVWRGYGVVRTTTGVGTDEMVTQSRYYRGLHGDHRPGGTPLVAQMPAIDMNGNGVLTDAIDVPATPDEDAFAGQAREKIVFNGTAEVSASVSVLTQSAPTASRTINGVTVHARFTNVEHSRTRTSRDHGRAPRTTAARYGFDDYGRTTSASSSGDEAAPGDERCTLTEYARNLDESDGEPWILAPTARRRDFAVPCPDLDLADIDPATVIADVRTYYDHATTTTAAPTAGLVTREQSLIDWAAGEPTYIDTQLAEYDEHGRPRVLTDTRGKVTTTTYTHNAGGQLSSTSVDDGLGWPATVTTYEPAFGQTTSIKDVNARITRQAYDGLGRLTKVWKPGRETHQVPNLAYAYTVRRNAPTVVTTTMLGPNGTVTSYELYDGLLRPKQVQAPRGDGQAGTIVTDTFYDTAGRVWKTYGAHLAPVTPGTELYGANEQGEVPSRTELRFDGSGRTIDELNYVRDSSGLPTLFARTSTYHAGDRVDLTPPAGATASSTFVDAGGRTTALWQYHDAAPTPTVAGSYDATTYAYTLRGQLDSITDGAGNQWTYEYNTIGQVVQTTSPDRGTTKLEHSPLGDLVSVEDSRGEKIIYTYNLLGQKTGLYSGSVAPANLRAAWHYGGLTNSRAQMTKSVRYHNGAEYIKEVTGFTATYQPTGVKYTIPLAETGLSGSFSYTFTYRSDNSVETARLPDIDGTGGLALEVLTTEYNALGRPNKLRSSLDNNTTYVAGAAYTGYGELATTTLQYKAGPTATLARAYEEGTRRLSQFHVSRATVPTTLADLRFSYDTAGNTRRIADQASGDYQCFGYDWARRLTDAWTPAVDNCGPDPDVATLGGPARYWTSWEYNLSGTRRIQIEHATPNGVRTTDYDYPDDGQPQPHSLTSMTVTDGLGSSSSSWQYDDAGNTEIRPVGSASQTIEWDPEGKVASIQEAAGTTEFIYDADGERIIRRDPTGKTLYLPGQELRYTTAGGAKTCTRYYDFGGAPVATRSAAGVSWLANDPQGTAMVTINAVTQVYAVRRQDPYGNQRGNGVGTWPSTMDKGFVGATKDNTGLTHVGAREYDPVLGRFISPDPVLRGFDPQHFDTYAYGMHNPFGFPDPTGTDPQGDEAYYRIGEPIFLKPIDLGDGYIYYMRIDFYVLCRSAGQECVATINLGGLQYTYWAKAWEIYRAILFGVRGVGFKVYREVSVSRRAKNFIGPTMGPLPKVKASSYGVKLNPPPTPPERKCAFNDMGCLFSADWDKWWEQNGFWIKGSVTAIGAITCLIATAGLGGPGCGAGAAVMTGSSLVGSTTDFAAEHYDNTAAGISVKQAGTMELAKFFAGLAWDAYGGKLMRLSDEIDVAYGLSSSGDGNVLNPVNLVFRNESGETPMFSELKSYSPLDDPKI